MRRARWVLVAAFALSVIIHVLVAVLVHPPRPSFAREQGASLQPTIIVRLTPRPPAPRPTPHRISVPHVVAMLTRHAPIQVATAAPSQAPKPARTARQARCTSEDAPAALSAAPPPPQIPPAVRALDVSGTAGIRVQIAADGSVQGATIATSTGDASFDAIAIAMARDAQYAAARHDCKAVASSYLFRVEFSGW